VAWFELEPDRREPDEASRNALESVFRDEAIEIRPVVR
jgi:hypothetical protein